MLAAIGSATDIEISSRSLCCSSLARTGPDGLKADV